MGKMDLRGKRILVVGLARTGMATARFLKDRGAVVSATDIKSREEAGEEVNRELDEMGLSAEWGGHHEETFLAQDLIVVSPGVDLAIKPIQKAMKEGIPILSEIELAYRFIHVPIIAVTGTNGKTTTTLLIGEMLKEDGRIVGVGGNVGEPLILFADEKK
jgi:UDP-N-acetylmuramoylalanine--D-glutamate ligase